MESAWKLVDEMTNGESRGARIQALHALRQLASEDSNRMRLCDEPGLLPATISVLQNPDPKQQSIRKKALLLLKELTENKECMTRMKDEPGLIEALLDMYQEFTTGNEELVSPVNTLLEKIGIPNPRCTARVNPEMVEKLVLAMKQATAETRPSLIKFLAGITTQSHAKDRRHFKNDELLKMLVDHGETATNEGLRYQCYTILAHLANEETMGIYLAECENPDVLELCLAGLDAPLSSDKDDESKPSGLEGLLKALVENEKHELYDAAVLLAGNLARWQHNRTTLRERGFTAKLMKLIDESKGSPEILFVAKLAVVNLVGADEAGINALGLATESIDDVVSFFQHMLRTPHAEWMKQTWELIEALQPLSLLAVSGQNRKLNVLRSVTPLLVDCLKQCVDGNLPEETYFVVSAIAQFVFEDEIKQKWKKDEKLKASLRECSKKEGHRWKYVAQDAEAVLWHLKKDMSPIEATAEPAPVTSSLPKENDDVADTAPLQTSQPSRRRSTVVTKTPKGKWIMVSYNHAHQVIAKKIVSKLLKANFKVWVDYEEIGGNLMDKMSEAVEGAHTIIVCMSTEYSESPNCKREATYAVDNKKQLVPVRVEKGFQKKGWLGIATANALVYDAYDDETMEESMPRLIKHELEEKNAPKKS